MPLQLNDEVARGSRRSLCYLPSAMTEPATRCLTPRGAVGEQLAMLPLCNDAAS
jgi:hypothetical protein